MKRYGQATIKSSSFRPRSIKSSKPKGVVKSLGGGNIIPKSILKKSRRY